MTSNIPSQTSGLIHQLKTKRLQLGMSQAELATVLGAGRSTVGGWEIGRHHPKPEHIKRIEIWLQEDNKPSQLNVLKEAEEYCEQLKRLLTLLEFHLRYFQSGHQEVREIYRKQLDVYDVGYLTSLLEMLFDEDKFQRWKVFTNHRFSGFRRKGHGRKGENKSQSG